MNNNNNQHNWSIYLNDQAVCKTYHQGLSLKPLDIDMQAFGESLGIASYKQIAKTEDARTAKPGFRILKTKTTKYNLNAISSVSRRKTSKD